MSAATGLQLQVDCSDLAMGRITRHADLSDDEFAAISQANVAALNYALQGIPASQVRIHVCWGNYAGPHHHDIAAASVWPAVARINAKYILIEAANPRHGHEVAAFEEAVSGGLIDSSKVIVPGVIDTTAARVEHRLLLAQVLRPQHDLVHRGAGVLLVMSDSLDRVVRGARGEAAVARVSRALRTAGRAPSAACPTTGRSTSSTCARAVRASSARAREHISREGPRSRKECPKTGLGSAWATQDSAKTVRKRVQELPKTIPGHFEDNPGSLRSVVCARLQHSIRSRPVPD